MSKSLTQRHRDLGHERKARMKEGRIGEFVQGLADIFADKSVSLTDFTIRGLFEALVDDGREYVETYYRPQEGGYRMLEAADAINTSLFANIQGQLFFNAIMRGYEQPELIGDSLVTIIPTTLSGEKMPGIAAVGDQVETVGEGNPYPKAGTSEYWIETPETIKRGLLLDITKEAIFFDKTGILLTQASDIGRSIAINREKRILDVVLGIQTVYKRNGSAAVATYTSTNTTTGNALLDWVSLDTADSKLAEQVDPDTGEPIVCTAKVLIIPPVLRNLAKRIINATMTNQWVSGLSRETRGDGNSLNQEMSIACNQYVKQRTGSDTTWFHGDPKRAFAYMQNWPISTESQPVGSDLQFERDIVYRYKTSERGAAAVLEPRNMIKATP